MRRFSLLTVFLAGWLSSSAALGQSETFDDLVLDGGGSASPFLRFEPNGNPAAFFRFQPDSFGLSLDLDTATHNSVVKIYNDTPSRSFAVRGSGVGVGTNQPDSALHVYADHTTDSAFSLAKVTVENFNAIADIRTMFELINNGPSRFQFSNIGTGQTWAFQTNQSDGFLINRLGSGGNEMSIRKTGLVTMGPGGKLNFVLDPSGNLTIDGTVTQNSDRHSKEAFQPVDCQEILQGVIRLPITIWRYKDDPQGVRHIGPVSQDFRKEFHMGKDNKSIAAVDADGVALAAIQALNQRIDKLAASVAKKDQALANAEQRIAELESRLRQYDREP